MMMLLLTYEVAHSKLFKRCMKNLSREAIDAGGAAAYEMVDSCFVVQLLYFISK